MSNGPVSPTQDRTGLECTTRDARMALREAASAAAEAAAHARSVAEVLDEALAVLAAAESAAPPPSPATPSARTDRLSSREQEVLALVTEGRTNKAIAEALYVSPNTVKTHVASLLNKLHAANRAQLAAIATTRGFHPPHPTRRHLLTSPNSHHDTVSR